MGRMPAAVFDKNLQKHIVYMAKLCYNLYDYKNWFIFVCVMILNVS